MLEIFFETEERKGGGKVKNIFIDGKNRCALIEFKDETGKIHFKTKENIDYLTLLTL
jgi:hypothetical protein